MKNRTDRALLDFVALSDSDLSVFAGAVMMALTGNSDFPQAADELATLEAARDAYVAALAVAKDGSRLQAAEKNDRKDAVVASLRILCSLVNFVARGNRVMLLGSGFNISKETTTRLVIEQAKNVIVKHGPNSGELFVIAKGVAGNKGLVFEYALAGNGATDDLNWISKPSSRSRFMFENLPVGKAVQIRVGISGPRKQLVYTQPVFKYVA